MSNQANNNAAVAAVLEGVQENVKAINSQRMNKATSTGLRLKTGIIGCGAGGSNIAHLLTPYGYTTAALNTTVADMTGLNIGTKITISGLNGSGKDRQFASNEFKKSYKNFFGHEDIIKLIEDNDLIVIPATAGGGTGTILAIMVAGYIRSEYPNKITVIAGMLPSLKDDKTSQENTLEFLSDLDNKTDCMYMLFDNNKVTDKFGDAIYDAVNQEVVTAIRNLSKEFMIENTRSNIDGRDYARLTSFTGLMSVISINNLGLSVSDSNIDIEAKVRSAITGSTAVVTDNPSAYGFYMAADGDVYSNIDTSFDAVQRIVGHPTEGLVFKHLQENKLDNAPQFCMIMTGLDSPVARYRMTEKRIEEYSRDITKAKIGRIDSSNAVKVSSDMSKQDGKGTNFMNSF